MKIEPNSRWKKNFRSFYGFYQFEFFFFSRAVNPDQMAETLFKNCDTNKDGSISFQEFAMTLYFLTHASKEEKLKHIFILLDADGNGTLSSTEVSMYIVQIICNYLL